MLKCADGWRHMSPALNFKYCSKLVIGRLSCWKYPDRLARILWWRKGGCRQTPVWSPANASFWPNAVSILAHRQRRWTNIETTLGRVFVFAGRAVRILIHACRLFLVGTGSTVLCVTCILLCMLLIITSSRTVSIIAEKKSKWAIHCFLHRKTYLLHVVGAITSKVSL